MNELILDDGSRIKLGSRESVAAPKGNWVKFGDTANTRLIPREEWDDRLKEYSPGPDHAFLPPTRNQEDVGECNAEAGAGAMEFIRAVQGLPYVPLSAADLYARINNGVDQGSLLEDAMRELTQNGIGTVATCGRLWKNGSWKGQASPAERAKYRALEVLVCPTFDHCFSATLMGFALVSGVPWHGNYAPGPDGWLPRGGGEVGGHAFLSFKPESRGAGDYGIRGKQSWGDNWCPRTKNTFVVPEEGYAGQVGGWYAVRAVSDEGGIVPSLQA